jgi:hypothetical protein
MLTYADMAVSPLEQVFLNEPATDNDRLVIYFINGRPRFITGEQVSGL